MDEVDYYDDNSGNYCGDEDDDYDDDDDDDDDDNDNDDRYSYH